MNFKENAIPVISDKDKEIAAPKDFNATTSNKPSSSSQDWWQSALYPDPPRHSDR